MHVLMWRNDAGAGICVHTIIWHMHGYFRCHDNLACVWGHAFIKQVSLRNRRPQLLKNAMIALLLAAIFRRTLPIACWQSTVGPHTPLIQLNFYSNTKMGAVCLIG